MGEQGSDFGPEAQYDAGTAERETRQEPSRVVLYLFDVLGFSERVREIGLDQIHDQYLSLVAAVESRAGGRVVLSAMPSGDGYMTPVVGRVDLKAAYFSDTVLLWARHDFIGSQVSMDIALDFMCQCFHLGIPLRGGISVGDAVMDETKRIFLGLPIIEAARAETAQQWSGCSFGPSVGDYPVLTDPGWVLPFEKQVKEGRGDLVRGIALDWPRRWKKLFPDESLEAAIDGYRRPGFETYWEVTSEFVKFSAQHQEWWKNDALTGLVENALRPTT